MKPHTHIRILHTHTYTRYPLTYKVTYAANTFYTHSTHTHTYALCSPTYEIIHSHSWQSYTHIYAFYTHTHTRSTHTHAHHILSHMKSRTLSYDNHTRIYAFYSHTITHTYAFYTHMYYIVLECVVKSGYGEAMLGRLLTIIGLFCRISSL